MRRRAGFAASIALLTGLAAALPARSQDPVTLDGARAVNVMPPGQSGHISLLQFVQGQVTGDYGPHFADQLDMYTSFAYKPMQFGTGSLWTEIPGARIYRDSYGVPAVYADDRDSLFHGFGYAMAADRLFEMDLFRRAGHGTLSEILGEGFIAMDTEVRTLSEGAEARAAELAAAPPHVKDDLEAFSAGVNRYIDEMLLEPAKIPAELALLLDVPFAPWTPDDTLAFGEFAGRFFGEFGHGELEMAAQLATLQQRHGAEKGMAIFDDLFPAADDSPPTVPLEAGIFPRHTAPSVSGGTAPVNIPVVASASTAAVIEAAAARSKLERTLQSLRMRAGLRGFGSNQYVVDAAHTANGRALLVSEPQTGLAAPSFFWEVELHGGGFDLRGVTVPGLAFVPIGRNADSAWAVTSGLDANADTFAETLTPDGTGYIHDGVTKPFETRRETIRCNTPPTALLDLIDGSTESICASSSRTITVRRTVHGPLITEPDDEHGVAFARRSVVDGRIVSSFDAWTRATQARTVADFASASSGVAFGFNFMYVDAAGHAAYYHVGRYPLIAADLDPRFPIPGTGPYDWQGFEEFVDQPQAVDPPGGFMANWNNKPAVGWGSEPLFYHSTPPPPNLPSPYFSIWGPVHQVEAIQTDLAAVSPHATFEDMATIQRHVASLDTRARAWMPALLAAIDASGDASLAEARSLLAGWDADRLDLDGDGAYDSAGLAIFDRWVERVLTITFLDDIGDEVFAAASGVRDDGTYRSADNQDTPTFKLEQAIYGTFTHALRGETRVDYFGSEGRDGALVAALRAALESLAAEHGGAASSWREAVETGAVAAQGGGSVPGTPVLLNRGSYGQIVEPGGTPQTGTFQPD